LDIHVVNAFPTPPFMSCLFRADWLRTYGFRVEAGGAADIDLFLRAAIPGYILDVRAERPIRYRVHQASYTEGGSLWMESLGVLSRVAGQEPAFRDNPEFRKAEIQLWCGEINVRLRSGRFAEVRELLRRQGWRLPRALRLRLWLKAWLRIRLLKRRRFY
jgi:hypothetical protein